jgi:cell division protein FtsI/penicillin-binding protein 2
MRRSPTSCIRRSTSTCSASPLRELAAQAEAGTREEQDPPAEVGGDGARRDRHRRRAGGGVVAPRRSSRSIVQGREAASFTPYQSLFEPGSIVKPLVLRLCATRPGARLGAQIRLHAGQQRVPRAHRPLGRAKPVRDDHDCGPLTPHGILVNSSNIGAAYVGLLLEREQWRDYMAFYGFGARSG